MRVTSPFPSLFLAHGSPTLALEGGAWGEALSALGQELQRPEAIVVCSAHWESTSSFLLTSSDRPGVIHDFGGFPEALYQLDYPAPGSPTVAEEAAQLLRQASLEAVLDPQRPLDHGAWVPLRYFAADASVPIVQLSLPRPRTPDLLMVAGRALSPLLKRGVLLLGSGGIVHNLRCLDWRGNTAPEAWATAFQTWVGERLANRDKAALTRWHEAPGANESVPTSDHLDPLFFAMGASAHPPTPIFEGWQLGSLSLTSYRFP